MKTLQIAFGLAVVLSTSAAFGVTLGQSDTFQDGAENWQAGVGGLSLVSTGGPAGAGDQYLQISSGVPPLPPRLIAFNDAQWLGNFAAAGVTSVAVDLLNTGSSSLPMRIVIRESAGVASTPGYATSTPFVLPPDGLWHHVVFGLNAASLTGINSPQPLAVDLANVQDFRILASASPAGVGDVLTAQFGVDNVTAVPEPSGVTLLLLGAAAAASCFDLSFRPRPRRVPARDADRSAGQVARPDASRIAGPSVDRSW